MRIIRLHKLHEIKMAYNDVKETFLDLEDRVDIEVYLNKIYKHGNVYIIEEDNKLCGFAAIYMNDFNNRVAYMTLIGIKKQYRCKGYGKLLLGYCIKKAQEAGMKYLNLEVNKINKIAISFYESNGMKIVDDASEQSYYMRKEI